MPYIRSTNRQRLAGVVAERIKAISISIDLAQRSSPSGEYIHDLLKEDGRITVGMEESHIIHKIVVVDADNRVIDSADSSDIGKTSKDTLGGLMPLTMMALGSSYHFIYCRREGIHPLYATPRSKHYELSGWKWQE